MSYRGLDPRVIVGIARRREVGDGMEEVAGRVSCLEPTLADEFSRLWLRDGSAFREPLAVGA